MQESNLVATKILNHSEHVEVEILVFPERNEANSVGTEVTLSKLKNLKQKLDS